ncbi:X-linked retinitis pigmentosa GTPase regulator-like protein [Ooceraea biroi]|uniref:X-linked retinitis pigmentosa GTPase regulator-like protein n=1 Tax=Ooceraea biroi TaxID=2015173 RepID=A0A026VVP9_OOCBI|nr:X-linked retinitis pigmentosa GTPase regulator-like protein [Ooceraea biroi]
MCLIFQKILIMDSSTLQTENLFKLRCLIKTTEIRHSAQCKFGRKLFFALATSNADIILYFKREPLCLPVVKRVPWFQGSHKQIAAFCFDPSGIWLLCITVDGSLYMLPALTLIGENYVIDKRWKTEDVTYIPFVNSQLSHFRPTSVTWWKNTHTHTPIDIGIIGTECGAILFINLSNGYQMGITYINESISSLHICQNENEEDACLLITSKCQQQWRLSLEQHIHTFLHNFQEKDSYSDANLNGTTYDNTEGSVSKSKLQELKQLSVEKLAILKQKLIEAKNQTLGESLQCYDTSNNKESDNGIPGYSEKLECKKDFISPEPISKDMFLSLQYNREGQQLYTRYYPVTNHITVHDPNLAVVPLSVHKIFDTCETVLLAHRFFFITDINQHVMYIISNQLSEAHINEDCKFNYESVVGTFSFKNSKEVIRAVYKVAKFNNVISSKASQNIESKYTLPKNVKDIKIEISSLDSCIIVTNRCVYEVILRYFLSTNTFYDELLAINIAGQTYLWEVLHHLATQRSLYGQMLDILMKAVQIFGTTNFHPKSYGLLICLSESGLMQAMLLNHNLTRSHISFVRDNLRDCQIFVLQRLVTLYDPTNPTLRSRLIQCQIRRKITSYSQQSSQCDSIDVADNTEQPDTLIEEIVETFILVLLTLIHKKRLLSPNYKATFLYDVQLPEISKECSEATLHINFKRRSLSAGFSHVALIRNGDIYTWGSLVQGCLGTGSSVLRYGTPHALCFFRSMKIEVFSVSCGHCHTLAVTNNGIYAWGASQFGQLGLGKVSQCSTPELVTSLAQESIVEAVAGQYHSVALTADGRVFTWGWGVHGQLGHGNTDEKTIATLVTALLGTVVCHVSAGYAHTLVLSMDGIVYAFGCNVLGQLGMGSNAKSSLPMRISLPDEITLISTGYFHNLAVSNTNKLYIWGASPQVLRLQAQAQKKIRILEQQDANEKTFLEDGIEAKTGQTEMIISNAEMQKKPSENADLASLNVDLIEENQTHLKPSVVDTSLVKGQITQISAGCHHNALITKDGSLYTWGRNLDGQIGNGTRREVPIPTPLYYNPACIFSQIPPRHNEFKKMQNLDNNTKSNDSPTDNVQRNAGLNKKRINPVINAVGIACGYDYTIAIQPGGTVLAWGNNSRAQLGRIPAKETRDADDKLVLLKSSKRVVRLPNTLHVALDVPSQVPSIASPVISYQSNDASSLAGLVSPLSVIEKSPGELTLHYVLERFHGLYCSANIMRKSIELENYQACSKIAALQGNIRAAFNYQLKVLHKLSLQSTGNYSMEISRETTVSATKIARAMRDNACEESSRNIKRNTELFNRQAEKNFMESLENSVTRNWMKIPTSRSLNNLQALAQELYTFDCQGGLEELCRTQKNYNSSSSNIDADYSDIESNTNEDEQQERIDDLIFNENDLLSRNKNITHHTESVGAKTMFNIDNHQTDTRKGKIPFSDTFPAALRSQRNYVINEAIRALKFYFNNINNEANILKCEILQDAISFWLQHNLPIQSLENVLLDHIHVIYYPLGLLLFCRNAIGRYLDANKYANRGENWCTNDLFSMNFCLQVLSILIQHIDNKDDIMPEYAKIFSSLMADNYGVPLNGYPGVSKNNSPEQMMEGIISTVFSEMEDSRLFAHIKDSDAVNRLLMAKEDSMVFTCGHHFPISIYKTDIISRMETELLTFPPSLILPRTSQYLGNMLSCTSKPEILCPLCTVEALRATMKNS